MQPTDQERQQPRSQPWAAVRRERSRLVRDSSRSHSRAGDGSTVARNLWNTALSATMPPQHHSSPMLTSGGYWGSTKTLREDMDTAPQTPSYSAVSIHPVDPDPRREREPSVGSQHNLTAEGLSWKRLHMSRAKLKATATTSELLSGFAMVAMVELQINTPTNVPDWLFVLFTVCTTVLVSVHIFALMISTYILPNVDAVSKMQHLASSSSKGGYRRLGEEEQHDHSSMGNILESPHERMRTFIELAWAFSTVLGLFLFLVELAILCWVKFWDYSFTAAWAGTVIIVPVLVIFVVFVAHFYRSLVEQKVVSTTSHLDNLEAMRSTLNDVEVPGGSRGSEMTDTRGGHHDLHHRASALKSTGGDRRKGPGDDALQRAGSTTAHRRSDGIGLYTPETLSWRRMHVSRAKLKETVVSSTLLCAFALECMVELQVQAPTGCPDWLFSLFAVNTTMLISVHVIAAMISTYILPSIDSVCAGQELWEGSGLDPSLWGVKPSESPHERMRGFIETAWIFSSVVGLFLFLTEVSLLSWVKFWDVCIPAATYGSIAVMPFFLLCAAFCFRFHAILAGHTYEVRALGLKRVEEMKERLDAANDSYA